MNPGAELNSSSLTGHHLCTCPATCQCSEAQWSSPVLNFSSPAVSTVLCTSSYRVQFLYTISPAQRTVCLNSPPVSVDITCGHRPLVCGHFAQPPLNCTILHAICITLYAIIVLYCISLYYIETACAKHNFSCLWSL